MSNNEVEQKDPFPAFHFPPNLHFSTSKFASLLENQKKAIQKDIYQLEDQIRTHEKDLHQLEVENERIEKFLSMVEVHINDIEERLPIVESGEQAFLELFKSQCEVQAKKLEAAIHDTTKLDNLQRFINNKSKERNYKRAILKEVRKMHTHMEV